MMNSMAASHAADKKLNDAIFGASAAAKAAVLQHGAAAVTDATIGMLMDDEGQLACLPTMERVYRALPMESVSAYAPIAGLPDYLEAVKAITFADCRPDGYTAAVATAGGTGAIYVALANYVEHGDFALTSDWMWGTYGVICRETGSQLATYPLFDDAQNFNLAGLSAKADELLQKQNSLALIINTPAHNPTGFTLSAADWDGVLALCQRHAKGGKRIVLVVDIAYIDYAGEKNATRSFMKKFSGLPENILVLLAFSMSKGYTLYGQRTGALLAVSSSQAVIDEFVSLGKYASRATWSNINRAAMTLLVNIQKDKATLEAFEAERAAYYETIRGRAAIFMREADECGLKALPYKAGFFISLPMQNAAAVCEKLHDDLVFAVALKQGMRVAACSVPTAKMGGLAAKIKRAVDSVGGK